MFWVFLWGLELFQGYTSVSRHLCVPVLFPAHALQSSKLRLKYFFYFVFMKIITKLLSVLLVCWDHYGLHSTFCCSYLQHLELSSLEFFLQVFLCLISYSLSHASSYSHFLVPFLCFWVLFIQFSTFLVLYKYLKRQ